jgi:hypothetical protein
MADVSRIGVEEARRKVTGGGALLVCAYDDEEKCKKVNLQGSINMTQLASRVATLPKDQEIIFYCA